MRRVAHHDGRVANNYRRLRCFSDAHGAVALSFHSVAVCQMKSCGVDRGVLLLRFVGCPTRQWPREKQPNVFFFVSRLFTIAKNR